MKKPLRTAVFTGAILGLIIAGTPREAQAGTLFGDFLVNQDIDVGASVTFDVYNKYVWSGFLLDDDKVIRPSASFNVSYSVPCGDLDDAQNDELYGGFSIEVAG